MPLQRHSIQSMRVCICVHGGGHSPDAQRGLHKGGDAHTHEDGADELTDHVLVLTHAHCLGQEEGHGDGATEAGQIVLGRGRARRP